MKITTLRVKSSQSHLITIVYWLTMRDLMLLKSMTLIEALEAIFALKLRLMGYVVAIVISTLICCCSRLFRFWLDFDCLIDLRMLLLFMFLQVVLRDECLVAKAAIEDCRLHRYAILQLDHVKSDRGSGKVRQEIHFPNTKKVLCCPIFFDVVFSD